MKEMIFKIFIPLAFLITLFPPYHFRIEPGPKVKNEKVSPGIEELKKTIERLTFMENARNKGKNEKSTFDYFSSREYKFLFKGSLGNSLDISKIVLEYILAFLIAVVISYFYIKTKQYYHVRRTQK